MELCRLSGIDRSLGSDFEISDCGSSFEGVQGLRTDSDDDEKLESGLHIEDQ